MDGPPESLNLTIPGEPGQPFLDGVITRRPELAVVAAPHPLMGGEMTNPVVRAMARGFTFAGLGTLLFDFRGVGESSGVASGDPLEAETDYRAALALASQSTTVVVASGYSFGGATAMRVAASLPAIARVIVAAPPPALLNDAEAVFAAVGPRLTVIAAERDTFAPLAELRRLTQAAGGAFELVAGEDHFFGGALARLTELTRAAAGRSLLR